MKMRETKKIDSEEGENSVSSAACFIHIPLLPRSLSLSRAVTHTVRSVSDRPRLHWSIERQKETERESCV
jgi:hypothetical protein